MQNLYLVQNNGFDSLKTALGLETSELIMKIEHGLINNDMELCDYEDAGLPMSEVIEKYDYKLPAVALKLFGRSDKTINEHFGQIVFKHLNDECPQCGHEIDVKPDSGRANGKLYKWENKKCSNSNCDYAETGEPDWDCMPGGADYY